MIMRLKRAPARSLCHGCACMPALACCPDQHLSTRRSVAYGAPPCQPVCVCACVCTAAPAPAQELDRQPAVPVQARPEPAALREQAQPAQGAGTHLGELLAKPRHMATGVAPQHTAAGGAGVASCVAASGHRGFGGRGRLRDEGLPIHLPSSGMAAARCWGWPA